MLERRIHEALAPREKRRLDPARAALKKARPLLFFALQRHRIDFMRLSARLKTRFHSGVAQNNSLERAAFVCFFCALSRGGLFFLLCAFLFSALQCHRIDFMRLSARLKTRFHSGVAQNNSLERAAFVCFLCFGTRRFIFFDFDLDLNWLDLIY
ncbi:MAG: hypothetical protein IKC51_06800 [Myxococcaceae bacterium]|nr:hypothetical protein [Myxococcaceae bacterium]